MEKEELRVKFYSEYDMTIGYYFSRIVNVIENFNSKKKITDINEIIELYNIQLFISNKIYPTDWDEQKCKKYTEVANSFSNTIGIFFLKLTFVLLINCLRLWKMIIVMIFGYLFRSIRFTKNSHRLFLLNYFQAKIFT